MPLLYPHLKSTKKSFKIQEGQENQSNSAMSKTVRQKIIEKYLDPDSGLLDKLLGCGLLTWEEFDDIRTTGSQRSKNEKLMNFILNRGQYQQLLDLLKETQHSHLTEYENDSDYIRRLFGGDIPLTRREETILDLNRGVMVELFNDSSQLAERLRLEGVLNDQQLHRIGSTSSNIERSEMLLDMIRKRSVKDFKTSISCLRDSSQQNHIADILEGGVTGRVICHQNGGTKPVDEGAIVSGLLTELSDRKHQMDRTESCLHLLKLGLSYVMRSNGIVFYFHFRSLEQLQTLRTEFMSGSLKQKAGEDFSYLTALAAKQIKLTLDWPDHDYQRCKLYFTMVPSTTVDDLPLEVLDMILHRTVQFLKLREDEASDSTDVNIVFSLASVSVCWSRRLSKSFLKKAVHRSFNAKVQKTAKRSAILRNNREYLVSEIQPNQLINQLVQFGCLDEKQASSLRRLGNDTDKNSELIKMARKFSSQSHFQLVESLYLTNHLNAAKVVERGGVTVKLCIQNETVYNITGLEKDFVRKLQKMLRESNDEKVWPHNLFKSVSIYDVVILTAQQGRGVVDLWLWCQSQEALDGLRNVEDSELIKITQQLFSRFPKATSLNPLNAHIASSYFQFDVVVRRMSATFRGSLSVKGDQSPSGATSLGDKIYVTVGSKVLIYEAEAPYRRLERAIKPPGIRMIDSVEVVACSVNECLYINDPDTDAIWKVNPDKDYELTKWLSDQEDIKVSTSSRGEVLVLDTNHSLPFVSVYTRDAVLQRNTSIPLRAAAYSIRSPAVEIQPEVVAVSFVFGSGNQIRKGIVVASLSGTGQVLREIEWNGLTNIAPHSLGRFVAADGVGKRLMVLDCQLYPIQVIFIPQPESLGISGWPSVLCYEREGMQVIVEHLGYRPTDGFQLDFYKLSYDEE